MNTQKKQPHITVRDMVESMSDDEVGSDSLLSQWTKELADAKVVWQASCKVFDEIRFKVAGLPAEVDALRAQIDALDAQRPGVIAEALLGNANFSADDDLLKRRAALVLHIERVEMAKPSLERHYNEANNRVSASARPVISIEDNIESRRKSLKLEIAERRCA